MSMKYRRLDDNGDYRIGSNSQDFLLNDDAVAQAIITNLKLLKGEWWEDLGKGLPLFQNILVSNGSSDSIKIIDLLIKQNILSVKNVSRILSYESSYDVKTRTYTVTKCTIITSFKSAITFSNISL